MSPVIKNEMKIGRIYSQSLMLMRSGLGQSLKITEDNHSCVSPWPVIKAEVGTEVWGGKKETHTGEEKMLIAAQNLQPEITTRNSPFWKSINYLLFQPLYCTALN